MSVSVRAKRGSHSEAREPEAEPAGVVIDLMQALKKSLEGEKAGGEAKKPAKGKTAEVRRQELDTQRLNGDSEAVAKRLDEARRFLAACLEQARGETEVNDLLLARARLELTPNVGRPEIARESVDRVLRSAAWPAQRDAARRLRVVALAQSSRFVEAEQAARREAVLVPGGPATADPAALLMVAWARQSQWHAIARGKLMAWGRKPWLGFRFRSLLRNP